MRRILSVLASIAMFLGLSMTLPLAADASAYCGIHWGSMPERAAGMSTAQVEGLRSGQHTCYDRLVVDLDGDVEGYTVAYVDTVLQPGSGFEVPLEGGADLEIVVNAPAYDSDGNPSCMPGSRSEAVDVDGYRTFRQVAFVGSFEGYTTIGLGVRARLPMRVFTLDGPGDGSRLVIDVAHRW